MEDEFLDAAYEDRYESYQNDDSYDDVCEQDYRDDEDDAALERQEMEDFEQADEYFGCFGSDD